MKQLFSCKLSLLLCGPEIRRKSFSCECEWGDGDGDDNGEGKRDGDEGCLEVFGA